MIDGKLGMAGLRAFLVALFLTPIVRDVFRSYNVVDRPGRRKVHAYPIPRVGGIPIAAAYVFTLAGLFGQDSQLPGSRASALLPGATIIFLTGLFDDFFNLRPRVKLLGQIAAAAAVFAAGLRLGPIDGVTLPVWLNGCITILWLLLTTNALNLIDGLDGLCAGAGLIGAFTFLTAGMLRGQVGLVWVSLPLVTALLGFLFHNFNPATVFLGDSGALLVGLLLGGFGLMWTSPGVSFSGAALPLLALSVPLTDLILSIVRRTLKGQPIFSADRGHIHHRLLDRGLTVRGAAVRIWMAASLGSCFALLMGSRSGAATHAASALGFAVAVVLLVTRLRYPEFEVARRLIFRREFRTALAEKSRLEYLAKSLETAQNEDEWWNRITELARDLNWTRVTQIECQTPGGDFVVRQKALSEKLSEGPPSWSFRVALGPGESLQAEGDVATERQGFDLPSFAAVVARSFRARSGGWRRHVLS
jgi:UDP-GlcNAc:undecaprenyl-phosphate GlcNAc-1-phosphate transferase